MLKVFVNFRSFLSESEFKGYITLIMNKKKEVIRLIYKLS